MALQQKTRMLGLKSPLGDDVLLLTAFSGREEMSRLFTFELDMLSDKNDIAAKDIVGAMGMGSGNSAVVIIFQPAFSGNTKRTAARS